MVSTSTLEIMKREKGDRNGRLLVVKEQIRGKTVQHSTSHADRSQ